MIIVLHISSLVSSSRVLISIPHRYKVKEGETLSIHCQVWEEGENERGAKNVVQLSRRLLGEMSKSGRPQFLAPQRQHLSWNDGLLDGVKENTFLAVKPQPDGSMVYFLTLLGVTREDTGDYRCQLLTPTDDGLAKVAGDVVTTDILNYPSADPTCSSAKDMRMTVNAGDRVRLNCSSEIGNPPVNIAWRRTGDLPITPAPVIHTAADNRTVNSELTFIADSADDGAVFVCQITSVEFPGAKKNCYVGPLTVIGGDADSTNQADTGSSSATPTTITMRETPADLPKCDTPCPYFATRAMPWLFGSVAAAFLTCLFIVVDVTLCLKLRHVEYKNKIAAASDADYSYPPIDAASSLARMTQDIYVELDSTQQKGFTDGGSHYMALQIPKPIAVSQND